MSTYKFLIDTNIVIGLEDVRPIDVLFADLSRKSSEYGVRLFVHGAVYDDIARDKDPVRRNITLSKLEKFEKLAATNLANLAQFGPVNKPNDLADVRLLAALNAHSVDFLITQDAGLHKRAEKFGLGANVLTVKETVEWLRQTFEPKDLKLPFISKKKAYEVDKADNIFDSLREGYPEFDEWFEKCAREHRDCWLVDVGTEVAGIVIRKTENHAQAETVHLGPKILKICTFKLKPEFRGEKFGEQLLKQIIWFSQKNEYDLIYLTTFSDQDFLINLLTYFGFEKTKVRKNGEIVLEKILEKGALKKPNDSDFFSFDRKNYPRFWLGPEVKKFSVPILPSFHQTLFPEISETKQLSFFSGASSFSIPERKGIRIPGNTIRKVYICRSKTKKIDSGDILFFYMSKNENFERSQSITTVAIVERVHEASTLEDVIRLTGKRSVFSLESLRSMAATTASPLKIIDFLLVGHLEPHITLDRLIEDGIFKERPPQSIAQISESRFSALLSYIHLGFPL